VGGRYALEEIIGSGATSEVYRGRDLQGGPDVAVKLLRPELTDNPLIVMRFLREARLASRVTHPGILRILLAGQLDTGEGPATGTAFLVTEFVRGPTLRAELSRGDHCLPLPRALRIISGVAEAVGAAHQASVIHRDLKPENIMLVRRGLDPDGVKVLDFGAARLDLSDASVVTHKGAIFGTARYVAPECAQGRPATAASDVYALATMLYECLAGRTPFDAKSPVEVLILHASSPVPPLGSLPTARYVPSPIADVIHDNLSKLPAERAKDALAFAQALARAREKSGIAL
jgi:serine/threonine protein kinase